MYPFSAFRFKVQPDHVYHIEIDDIKDFHTFVWRSRAQVSTVYICRQSIDATYILMRKKLNFLISPCFFKISYWIFNVSIWERYTIGQKKKSELLKINSDSCNKIYIKMFFGAYLYLCKIQYRLNISDSATDCDLQGIRYLLNPIYNAITKRLT